MLLAWLVTMEKGSVSSGGYDGEEQRTGRDVGSAATSPDVINRGRLRHHRHNGFLPRPAATLESSISAITLKGIHRTDNEVIRILL